MSKIAQKDSLTAQVPTIKAKKPAPETSKAERHRLDKFFKKLDGLLRKYSPKNSYQRNALETARQDLKNAINQAFPPTPRRNKAAKRLSLTAQGLLRNAKDQQLTDQAGRDIPIENQNETTQLWNRSYNEIAQRHPGEANKTGRQALRKCDDALKSQMAEIAQAPTPAVERRRRTEPRPTTTSTQVEQAPSATAEARRRTQSAGAARKKVQEPTGMTAQARDTTATTQRPSRQTEAQRPSVEQAPTPARQRTQAMQLKTSRPKERLVPRLQRLMKFHQRVKQRIRIRAGGLVSRIRKVVRPRRRQA